MDESKNMTEEDFDRFEAALKHILYVAMLLDKKILLTAYKDEIERGK